MRTSVNIMALVATCLLVVLLPDLAATQGTGDGKEAEVIDPTRNKTDFWTEEDLEGSGEGEGETFALKATEAPEEPEMTPHLVVMDAYDQPCLLATLNATMEVSYRVPEGIVHEFLLAKADIQLPEDVHAQGVCGENSSRLLLDWGNSTFHMNITFTRKDTEDENSTWSLTGLSISYNLSNNQIFRGSSETDTVTMDRQNLNLFTTRVGNTHVCDNPVCVQVGSHEHGVLVTFHSVRLAAFGVSSSEFPKNKEYCTKAETEGTREEILVPLIVACVLSAVVIVIVVAYVIGRRVQVIREQSEYRQMP